MKTSFNALVLFLNNAIPYIKEFKGDQAKEKLIYALQKKSDQASPIAMKMQEDMEKDKNRIRIKHAMLDEDGSVMYSIDKNGVRQFKMTPESMIACDEECAALPFKEVEIDLKIHVVAASNIPSDLHESFIKVFKGFVIAPDYVKPESEQAEELEPVAEIEE